MWLGFLVCIAIMLAIDLFLLGSKKGHEVSVKESLAWVTVWITLALLFNFIFLWYLDKTQGSAIAHQKAMEFLTGYLIEKSLSVDNMFVFIMIFHYFNVPTIYQHRVLFLGVIGAIVMRLVLILAGVWLIAKFSWILYIFGLFLVISGIKMFVFAEQEPDLSKNKLLIWINKYCRVTDQYYAEKFFVLKQHKFYMTPLFLVLILIEISDLVFSVDSIPAIFAITTDPFIVYTSNIFAILGLRSLYFLLSKTSEKFSLLKYGLALILIFVGGKMLIAHWFKMPITVALAVVASILGVTVLLSIVQKRRLERR